MERQVEIQVMDNMSSSAPPVMEETLSQLDVLIQLYEGCIQFLDEAAVACDEGRVVDFKYSLQRGRRIIEEFQKTLDFTQGGQVPAQLNDLYLFMLDSLTQAGLTHDSQYIHRVNEQLTILLDGWQNVEIPTPSVSMDH